MSSLVGSISNSNIVNNVDLINKVAKIDINYDFKLVSFDVTSSCTRVPICDLLEFLPEKLKKYDFLLIAIINRTIQVVYCRS